MINRILIRIKVLQIVYSYYQNGNGDLKVAENELLFSLQKSYDLYYYFLLLIIEVTNLQRRILDTRKCKYMPTDEELNPNTRFVDNRFVAQLAENDTLKKYVDEQGLSWSNDEEFVKNVLDTILSSEIYAEYLKNEEDSYETDREFWRQIFKKVICGNEMIEEYLEDKSIYWNDDIEIVETFALKTIKKFEEKKGSKTNDFFILPKKEGNASLCPACHELLTYARDRLNHCKFGNDKPTCKKCPVHCYRPDMKSG